MYTIKTLRLSVLIFIFGFASILFVTISPFAGKLYAEKISSAAPQIILVSGTDNVTPPKQKKKYAQAIFAMGCFWCAESDFEKVDGVVNVISGYTGGKTPDPNYKQVSYTETGHYESVLVTYDPKKVKYSKLLKVFWSNVDPFDAKGQFCDKGTSYRAAIFPGTKKEVAAAKASKDYLVKFFKKDLATKILPKAVFYPAETHHQDYYKKNPVKYKYYRNGCGRDNRLKAIWGPKKK